MEAIEKLDISGIDKDRTYYTLRPLYQDGKIQTPIDTNIFMRPVIGYEEAEELISLIPSIKADEYSNFNPKLLGEHYQELLQTHDCSDLIKLIKTIYQKKIAVEGAGKKLGSTDERYMKRAEEILHSELSVALGIPKDSVKCYIADRVQKTEQAFIS